MCVAVAVLVAGIVGHGCSGELFLLARCGAVGFLVKLRSPSLFLEALGLKNLCPGQKRFKGGGPVPSERATVKAVCLSMVGDPMQLELLWAQNWVETWAGWKELEEDGSDDKAVELAQRFLQIAGMNIPTQENLTVNASGTCRTQKGCDCMWRLVTA